MGAPTPLVRHPRPSAPNSPLPSRFARRQASLACCRYMGGTAVSKARCFCVLFVVHLVQILLRTATLSLLAATQGWFAAVYLVGDFLVMVAYKALRRDVLYWVPTFGMPLSLLSRFVFKVFTDSTSCAHFRHPLDLGGLYYCLNVFFAQALPPFSACPGGRAVAPRRRSDLFLPRRLRRSRRSRCMRPSTSARQRSRPPRSTPSSARSRRSRSSRSACCC
jgi:hypothetical protein